MRRPTAALAGLTALLAIGVATAETPRTAAPAETSPVRIVAIGDVHGELTVFRKLLREAELIDSEDRWVGGSTVLVQTGDYLDRGPDVAGVMDLLMDLQRQAAAGGGRVEVLLGNHEAMNLVHEYRDVSPAAYASFVAEGSEKRRVEAYKSWRSHMLEQARVLRLDVPLLGRAAKKQWFAKHPPGLLEYREALGPSGKYGAWLRGLPVAVRVGDSLFIHAGIGPDSVDRDLQEINDGVLQEILTLDANRAFLVDSGVALPFSDRSDLWTAARLESELRQQRGSRGADTARLRKIAQSLEALTRDADLLRGDGPLWYRGYALTPEVEVLPIVISTLENTGTRRIVAAHSTLAKARILPRLGARVYLIDTGMLSSYYRGGRGSALEIVGDTLTAIYEDGERVALANPVTKSAAPTYTSADKPPASD